MDKIRYLETKGWFLTSKGWVSPHNETAEYVRWDLESAIEIQSAYDKKKEVRDEWSAT